MKIYMTRNVFREELTRVFRTLSERMDAIESAAVAATKVTETVLVKVFRGDFIPIDVDLGGRCGLHTK